MSPNASESGQTPNEPYGLQEYRGRRYGPSDHPSIVLGGQHVQEQSRGEQPGRDQSQRELSTSREPGVTKRIAIELADTQGQENFANCEGDSTTRFAACPSRCVVLVCNSAVKNEMLTATQIGYRNGDSGQLLPSIISRGRLGQLARHHGSQSVAASTGFECASFLAVLDPHYGLQPAFDSPP